MANPFVLFQEDHLWALIIVLIVAVGPPLILRQMADAKLNRRFASILGYGMIGYGIFKHLWGPLGMHEAWQIWLPFHMCQISNFLIAWLLISGRRGRAVDLIYFWTYAGATMAMITPDLRYGWPDPNYILFMVTHGLLLLGALYFSIVEGYRPTVSTIWPVFKISLGIMLLMLPLNYIIGGEANYFYLRFPPVAGSVMDFLPAPPFHIPFVILLGYLAFWIVYLPFLILDLMQGFPATERGDPAR